MNTPLYGDILSAIDDILPRVDALRIAKYKTPVSFLIHSLSVAYLAAWIARSTGWVPDRLAFTAGFLHDYHQKISKNYPNPEEHTKYAIEHVADVAGLGSAEKAALRVCTAVNCAENPDTLIPGYGVKLSKTLRIADILVSHAHITPEELVSMIHKQLPETKTLILRADIPQLNVRTRIMANAIKKLYETVERPEKLGVILTRGGTVIVYPGELPDKVDVDLDEAFSESLTGEWNCNDRQCSMINDVKLKSRKLRENAIVVKNVFLDKKIVPKLYNGVEFMFDGIKLGGVEFSEKTTDKRCLACGVQLVEGNGSSFDARLFSNLLYGRGLERWSPRFKAHMYIKWSSQRKDIIERYVRVCPLCMLEALISNIRFSKSNIPVLLTMSSTLPLPIEAVSVISLLLDHSKFSRNTFGIAGFGAVKQNIAELEKMGSAVVRSPVFPKKLYVVDYATASIVRQIEYGRDKTALMYNGFVVASVIATTTLYPARYTVGDAWSTVVGDDFLVAERFYPAVTYDATRYARAGYDDLPAYTLALLHAASSQEEYDYLFIKPQHAKLAVLALGKQKLLSELGIPY